MMAYHLTIAAAATGLLLAIGSASASPLAATAAGPMQLDRFDGAVEPVHYRRRAARRHYSPYYRGGPAISFGYSPYGYAAPYYARPYGYPYGYGYSGYPYGYGYAPSFNFGVRLR